jgi:cyclophilin family peptidyl-prolyl cis-trans isomerase
MRRPTALAALAALLAITACSQPTQTPRPECPTAAPTAVGAQAELQGAERATIDTNKGAFTMELYGDAAPIATANFVALARCGYYDGISFHRVLAGFVIQAGDPQTRANYGDFEGLGTGGPGYGFEIEPPAEGLRYDPYVVAMANNQVANGSQFFVCLADLERLRQAGVYTIFGKVIEDTDVVDQIAQVPVNDPRIGLPLDPVIIETVSIAAAPEATPDS